MRKILLAILFLAVSSGCGQKSLDPSIELGGKRFRVQVADTDQERMAGLSNRENLPIDAGMLFIFPKKEIHTFWMKEMLFPLDIIWINNDEIIGWSENAQPEGDKPRMTYSSPAPVDRVLELSSGQIKALDLKIGDKIKYDF